MKPLDIRDFVQPEDGDDFGPAFARAVATAKTFSVPPGEYNVGANTLVLRGAIVGAPADPEAFG